MNPLNQIIRTLRRDINYLKRGTRNITTEGIATIIEDVLVLHQNNENNNLHITYDKNNVIFTLDDGSVAKLPFKKKGKRDEDYEKEQVNHPLY
jgi:hypothetical protein